MNAMRRLAVLLLMGSMSWCCTGCSQIAAAVLPLVADIITEVIDGQRRVEQMDAQAQAWFADYPNPELQAKWQGVVDQTQAALDVALQSAHGAQDMSEGDYLAAIQQFNDAWVQMHELASQVGFMGSDGTFAAGAMAGAKIPTPLSLSRQASRP